MRPIPSWVSVRRLLSILLVLPMACSSGGTEQLVDDPQPDARTVIKGGLDAPAVRVGPFLDGALPPRTPNAPGSGQWATVPAFPNLNLADTLVIARSPADDRMYVGSQAGVVVAFDNDSSVTATETFLDLRRAVRGRQSHERRWLHVQLQARAVR